MAAAGRATPDDTVRIESGSVRLAEPVIFEGRLDWYGGRLHSGGIDIAPRGELNLLGGADKLLTAVTLNNGGLIRWQDAGRLIGSFTSFGQSVLMTNLASGLFQVETDADLLLSSPGHGGELMRLSNEGNLVKLGGSATNSFVSVPTYNADTIAIFTGAVDFPAGLSNEGLITGGARVAITPPAVFPPTEPLTLILQGVSGLKYRAEATADPGAVGATVRCYRATVAPAN